MGKKENFAGWFLPSLQKAKNRRGPLSLLYQIVRMANVFALGSVDCGEAGRERAGEKSAGKQSRLS